jgi:hypothetical protein
MLVYNAGTDNRTADFLDVPLEGSGANFKLG